MGKNSINRHIKVIACIAVRMKSKRLPFKPLRIIEGKPMIVHLVERLKASKEISSIVLCTSTHPDDEILVDIAKECGIKYIAGSENDIISRFLKAAEMEGAEHVLRVTGDNVLTDPQLLDLIVEHHLQTKADYTRIDDVPLGIAPECISIDTLKNCREILSDDPCKSEYMMLYLYAPDRFHVEVLELPLGQRRPCYSLTVDTPKDLECVRRIFRKLYRPNKIIEWKEVIEFIDENPKDYIISSDAPIKMPGGKTITFEEWRTLVKERREQSRRILITL